MSKFQGSIKKEVELPRVLKNNSCGIKLLTIAKKRSSNKHTLLNKIKDAINDADLENISYFDISDFNTSFPKSQINGTNFFHMNRSSLCNK